jgi:hypothetical protein
MYRPWSVHILDALRPIGHPVGSWSTPADIFSETPQLCLENPFDVRPADVSEEFARLCTCDEAWTAFLSADGSDLAITLPSERRELFGKGLSEFKVLRADSDSFAPPIDADGERDDEGIWSELSDCSGADDTDDGDEFQGDSDVTSLTEKNRNADKLPMTASDRYRLERESALNRVGPADSAWLIGQKSDTWRAAGARGAAADEEELDAAGLIDAGNINASISQSSSTYSDSSDPDLLDPSVKELIGTGHVFICFCLLADICARSCLESSNQ